MADSTVHRGKQGTALYALIGIISFYPGFLALFTVIMLKFAKNMKNTWQIKNKKPDKMLLFVFSFSERCFITEKGPNFAINGDE
jgi:hypothetical protein